MTVQNRLVLDPDVCHMHTNGEKVNQDINRWVKSREIEGLKRDTGTPIHCGPAYPSAEICHFAGP